MAKGKNIYIRWLLSFGCTTQFDASNQEHTVNSMYREVDRTTRATVTVPMYRYGFVEFVRVSKQNKDTVSQKWIFGTMGYLSYQHGFGI